MSDCLIVGGGVVGLSLAYELAGRGLRVDLVDRSPPGREASWAGAGILPPACQQTAVDPLEELRGLSHTLHREWARALRDETGIDTGYRACGGIYLARTPGEAAALHGLAGMFDDAGIDMNRLSDTELIQLEPALREVVESGQLRAAYRLPDEAQLRNPHHLRALISAGRLRGVQIHPDVEVRQFKRQDDQLQAAITSQGLMRAARYCITSGAWSHRLLHDLGVETGILPIRGQMVLFKCAARPFKHIVNEGQRYLVPRDDGRVLVGSTEEEAGFAKETTDEALTELRELAYGIVPELRSAEVERSWAGLRPGSFDGLPYLGSLPPFKNAYVAAGHFRSGLHLSTATAVVMSDLICGDTPSIDLSPFRVQRGAGATASFPTRRLVRAGTRLVESAKLWRVRLRSESAAGR